MPNGGSKWRPIDYVIVAVAVVGLLELALLI